MNKLINAVILVTAIVVATAYKFDDADFNQVLASDLEDLYSYLSTPSLLHPRNRRDDEAVNPDKCRRKKKLCCAEVTMDEIHSRDKDIKRECFKEIIGKDKEPRGSSEFDPFRCDKVDKHRKEMMCVMQCTGQKLDLLDKDGNPKDTQFATFVKDITSKESWLLSIQDKVISGCLAEAKNATTSNRDASDVESCNPAGVKLAHCMFREIQLGCPDDLIKDQKSCARLRDRVKKQEFFAPPPQFMNDE